MNDYIKKKSATLLLMGLLRDVWPYFVPLKENEFNEPII